jgi:hypothetical protein
MSGLPESHADGNATKFHHIYFTHGPYSLGNSQSFYEDFEANTQRQNEYVSEFMLDYASEDTSALAPLVRNIFDSMTADALEFHAYSAR